MVLFHKHITSLKYRACSKLTKEQVPDTLLEYYCTVHNTTKHYPTIDNFWSNSKFMDDIWKRSMTGEVFISILQHVVLDKRTSTRDIECLLADTVTKTKFNKDMDRSVVNQAVEDFGHTVYDTMGDVAFVKAMRRILLRFPEPVLRRAVLELLPNETFMFDTIGDDGPFMAAGNGSLQYVLDKIEAGEVTVRSMTKCFDFGANGSLLHLACFANDVDLSEALVKLGADVNLRDNSGWTPLHHACLRGSDECVKFLVEHGSRIDEPSNATFAPLHIAAMYGNASTVKLLVELGAQINIKTKDEYTPLHIAAQTGHCDVVQALLDQHADKDLLCSSMQTPFGSAIKNGNVLAAELLASGPKDLDLCRAVTRFSMLPDK